VVITGRNQPALEVAVKELGPGLVIIQADTIDVGAIERVVATTVGKFRNLEIVFANAGIAAAIPAGETLLATFEPVLKTTLTRVFSTLQADAPPNEKETSRRQL
jgi:NAD(P)-dependent dehydrogenase (short-subunit alcohol dehydrogenase family)